jgi:hypothetical protein
MDTATLGQKRPKTDIKGDAVRHIPRGTYRNVPIDAMFKYLYRYSFHIFCTEFRVKLNTGRAHVFKAKDYEGYSLILEVINFIVDSTWNHDTDKYAGLPIYQSGVICHYNVEDPDDPYFTCTIKVNDAKDAPEKVSSKKSEVIYVGK